MAQFGLAITMNTQYRGATQEFSNVFHYRFAGSFPIAYDTVIDEIVGILKDLHSTQVNFVRARLWSSGGNVSENEMKHEKLLTGTGNQSTVTAFDRERAFLMQWPAGRSSTGKPVYLRKWFHSCGAIAGVAVGAGVLDQTSAMTEAQRDTISTSANRLRLVGPVDEYLLVAASGREHTGPGRVHKFLEHRQLGDQWR